jgi:hypothetical protein
VRSFAKRALALSVAICSSLLGSSGSHALGDAATTVGYVGCSNSVGAVVGYHADGGVRLWGSRDYGAGTIYRWANDIPDGSASRLWDSFGKAQTADPAAEVWLNLCEKADNNHGKAYSSATAVVDEIRRRLGDVPIYVSGMNDYVAPHVCSISGTEGAPRMQGVADQLVAAGLAYAGPVLPPLSSINQVPSDPPIDQTLVDGCHPNDEGKAFLGQALMSFFDGPPSPTLSVVPSDPSGPAVAFEFADDEMGVTFQCALDGSAFEACASPTTIAGLETGAHVFDVRAIDGAGSTSEPASFSWTVDATPPPAAFLASTPSDPSSAHVGFAFTDDEPDVSFLCAVDRVPSNPCFSPLSFDVSGGTHVFEVWASDSFGNVSNVTSFTWTVDSMPPTVTMIQPASDGLLSSTSVVASWTGSDDGAVARYEVFESIGTGGSEVLVQSSSSSAYSRLGSPGTTYCERVTAYDMVGNSASGPTRCSAVPFDDLDPAVAYVGAVTHVSASGAFLGTRTVLSGAGQQASLTFTGRKFGILASTDPSLGRMSVVLDGVVVATIDLYSAKVKTQYVLTRVVAPGTHTLTLAWSGTKNPASAGTAVDIDGIAVIATS